MELAELAAYAREKHHIQEQHKWADFPGFSVLAEPSTGKWAALLMRQWDGETGEEIQRCDIRCGRQGLSGIGAPFLAMPFRMKGQNWVGVIFDRNTDPEVVFRLFDRAVSALCGQQAYTVVLEQLRGNIGGGYRDTALPPRQQPGNTRGGYRDTALPPQQPGEAASSSGLGSALAGPASFEPSGRTEAAERRGSFYREREPGLPFGRRSAGEKPGPSAGSWSGIPEPAGRTFEDSWFSSQIPQIPEKIRQMMRLYEYRGESLEEKSRNFYRQGKFMEDYEDDTPWRGDYRRYFTTYRDLHLAQLRGYFTWRTAVRRGEFRPFPESLAYMYLYELLCGIGTSSPGDSLRRMKEFEEGFLDEGNGSSSMRRNLRRWMVEYGVIHGISGETLRGYGVEVLEDRDRHLAVLRAPDRHPDGEIFSALCFFAGNKLPQSPVITENPEKGVHLFAELWRKLAEPEPSVFTACFGKPKRVPWHPLSNAVYWSEEKPSEADYELNECRAYRCRGGVWEEEKYDPLTFNKDQLQGILHAGDRLFRKYLKTGHALRAKPEEAWVEPFAAAVIEADIMAEREAARPKITIDLSGLEKIRQDARITRDSLLAAEETEDVLSVGFSVSSGVPETGRPEAALSVSFPVPYGFHEKGSPDAASSISLSAPSGFSETGSPETGRSERGEPEPGEPEPGDAGSFERGEPEFGDAGRTEREEPESGDAGRNERGEPESGEAGRSEPGESGPAKDPDEPGFGGLDPLHTKILRALLREQTSGEEAGGGQSRDGVRPAEDRKAGDRPSEGYRAYIREARLLPSIVADTINEALFDEIGDTVLECDGEEITVVEDYIEELLELLD